MNRVEVITVNWPEFKAVGPKNETIISTKNRLVFSLILSTSASFVQRRLLVDDLVDTILCDAVE